MKKKEFNIKLNGLTNEELKELLSNTQGTLNKMKMNHRTAELENPLEIRTFPESRRYIALIRGRGVVFFCPKTFQLLPNYLPKTT